MIYCISSLYTLIKTYRKVLYRYIFLDDEIFLWCLYSYLVHGSGEGRPITPSLYCKQNQNQLHTKEGSSVLLLPNFFPKRIKYADRTGRLCPAILGDVLYQGAYKPNFEPVYRTRFPQYSYLLALKSIYVITYIVTKTIN
jgi:hypothetical protein